jgi:hypothetical protein
MAKADISRLSSPPTLRAQCLCTRCQQTVPLEDIRTYAGRTVCTTCHGELIATSRPPDLLRPSVAQSLEPRSIWQQLLVRIIRARISTAIFRCIAYLTAFSILGPASQPDQTLFSACLIGIFAADNFTWMVFRLMELPRALATFPIEAIITIGSGSLIISWQGMMPLTTEGDTAAMAFPAFMITLTVKMLIWGIYRSIDDEAA